MTPSNPISAVPTNIVTGFLGTGKTTAILSLLANKPESERWAILVNEFGEIGVDGSLLTGKKGEQDGVYVTEVPGGCMCCAAGLPMQIALNQLLSRAKPDRLLIEPTGLGHPQEVLELLSAEHYRSILDIQKVVTLVDARKLSDPRYTTHDTFNQQIEIADVIVGNKQDLYQEDDSSRLLSYVQGKNLVNATVTFTSQGVLSPDLLEGPAYKTNQLHAHHHHEHASKPLASELEIPETGFIKAQNSGEGFESVGWRFNPDIVFERSQLFNWITGLDVERLKAVFITEDGIFGYNLTQDALTEIEIDDCNESKVEIIAPSINPLWESSLFECALGNHGLSPTI